jgi:hypothetical protein
MIKLHPNKEQLKETLDSLNVFKDVQWKHAKFPLIWMTLILVLILALKP